MASITMHTRPSKETNMLGRLFASATPAHAHCDLYCGVYDPAQAKIEALSVVKTAQKYHESDDAVFQDRCIFIKEQRAEECKHHLMVLWADFFAPAHFDEFLSCTTCSGRLFIKRVRQRSQWTLQLASSSCRTSMRLPTFSGRQTRVSRWCVPTSLIPNVFDVELNLGAWRHCQAPFFFHAGGRENQVPLQRRTTVGSADGRSSSELTEERGFVRFGTSMAENCSPASAHRDAREPIEATSSA